MYSLWHRKGNCYGSSLLFYQRGNNWDKTFYLLHEKYSVQGFASQKALDEGNESFVLWSGIFLFWSVPHDAQGASFNLYMEICDMSAGSLYRTKPENQCTLQCVEKWQVITCAASSKHTVALQVNTAHSERFLTLWIARHEREQRLCLYADTWQVTGPVQWHIEWIRMGFYNKSSTLHLTLQLSTFFLRKKI